MSESQRIEDGMIIQPVNFEPVTDPQPSGQSPTDGTTACDIAKARAALAGEEQ